jgi:acetyl esterase/lipase
MRSVLALAILSLCGMCAWHAINTRVVPPAPSPGLPGASAYFYKQTASRPLYLYVLEPRAAFERPRPAIIFFFGGGWTGGTTRQFVSQARYFAARGLVAVLADYRVQTVDGTTPFDAVRDARSAVRWVRGMRVRSA